MKAERVIAELRKQNFTVIDEALAPQDGKAVRVLSVNGLTMTLENARAIAEGRKTWPEAKSEAAAQDQ